MHNKKTSNGGRTYWMNFCEHGCKCGKLLINGFPSNHIPTTYKARSIDFRTFVQNYTPHMRLTLGHPCLTPHAMSMKGLHLTVQLLCLQCR